MQLLLSLSLLKSVLLASEGEVILLLEGESRTVFGVELRKPPPVLDNELILLHQNRLQVVLLVVPCNHITFQLKNRKFNSYVLVSTRTCYIIIIPTVAIHMHSMAHKNVSRQTHFFCVWSAVCAHQKFFLQCMS